MFFHSEQALALVIYQGTIIQWAFQYSNSRVVGYDCNFRTQFSLDPTAAWGRVDERQFNFNSKGHPAPLIMPVSHVEITLTPRKITLKNLTRTPCNQQDNNTRLLQLILNPDLHFPNRFATPLLPITLQSKTTTNTQLVLGLAIIITKTIVIGEIRVLLHTLV